MATSLGISIYQLSILLRLMRPITRDQPKLSEREILLLFLLRSFGKCKVSVIAERLDVPIQTASTYLKNLEQRKYVTRQLDPADSRCHFIDLTPTGAGVLKRIETMRGNRYDDFIVDMFKFSASQLQTIQAMVDQAIDVLRQTGTKELDLLRKMKLPGDDA